MKRFKVVFDDDFKPTIRAESSWELLSILSYIFYPWFPAGIQKIKDKETGKVIPFSHVSPLIAELKCSRAWLQKEVLGSDKEIEHKSTDLCDRYDDLKKKAQGEDKCVREVLLEELNDKFDYFPVSKSRP
jgi:hypothetical protein